MTSVATISPVSLSLIAFMIIGPSDRSLLMLSIFTSLSSPSSRGFSSGTDISIRTSPDRILCMTLDVEQDTARKAASTKASFASEHIGKGYHYIIRAQEELIA